MNVQAKEIPATGAIGKLRFPALRRWWIEINFPARDADLTVGQWEELASRYIAAGGTAERFEALIEKGVRES